MFCDETLVQILYPSIQRPYRIPLKIICDGPVKKIVNLAGKFENTPIGTILALKISEGRGENMVDESLIGMITLSPSASVSHVDFHEMLMNQRYLPSLRRLKTLIGHAPLLHAWRYVV